MTPRRTTLERLDLCEVVRDGDTVLWGQWWAEPRTLVQALLQQRHFLGRLRCFVGVTPQEHLTVDDSDVIDFVSYTGSASPTLAKAGRLEILPLSYSNMARSMRSGEFRVDVVFLHLPPALPDGRYAIGLADEYLHAALAAARTVIAEVNDRIPVLPTASFVEPSAIDVVIETSHPLPLAQRRQPTTAEHEAARNAASLVSDRACLQVGLGVVPEAVVDSLVGHRNLAVHSGLVNDAVAQLAESGAIAGRIEAGVLMGGDRLLDFARSVPDLGLHATEYTHDPARLAALERFTAINSAIEVDLTGQVNTEVACGRYVGAIGGIAEFLRGARVAPGGLPLVVLASTAGPSSRIVATLSGPVSVTRADAPVIVTEHGVADLRGLPLSERISRMIAVADPAHRDRLVEESRATLGALLR